MRKLYFLFLLIPFVAGAQLERVRVNMTEEEFVKEIPEAKRDPDSEAGWLNDTTRIGDFPGKATWRIYNDSVIVYRFSSEPVEGPSREFPGVDSADVHGMKETAMNLVKKMQFQIGKPTRTFNYPFIADKSLVVAIVYLAEWEFPDKTTIHVVVSKQMSVGNKANARNGTFPTAAHYELEVYANNRSNYTRMNYSIGKSSDEFFLKYPQLAKNADFLNYHHYTIPDTAIQSNAEWKFSFTSGNLVFFTYRAWCGTAYGSESDEEAYLTLKKKAEEIIAQGNKAFGQASTFANKLAPKYERRDLRTMYEEELLDCKWQSRGKTISCTLTEMGGGKHRSTAFNLRVDFPQ